MTTTPDFGFDDSAFRHIIETQQLLSKMEINGTIAMIQNMQQYLTPFSTSESIKALESISQSIQAWCIPELEGILKSAQTISEILSPISQQLIEQQSWISKIIPSIDMSLRDAISFSYTDLEPTEKGAAIAADLDNIICVDLPENVEECETTPLTESEGEQLTQDISAAISDKRNWQQRLMDVLTSWKKRNPVIAAILQQIIFTLIVNILINSVVAWGGKIIKEATIRNEPNTSAAVVAQVKQTQDVDVIGEVPYYYLIEFYDPEADKRVRGYISKRSVKPAENPDEPTDVGRTSME